MGSFAFLSFIFCSGFVSRKWPRGLQPGIFFFSPEFGSALGQGLC